MGTKPTRLVHAFGKTRSAYEWSRMFGVHPDTIMKRVAAGMEPEIAILKVVSGTARRLVVIGGIERTIGEWSKLNGVNLNTIHSRLRRGWDPGEAVSTKRIPQHLVCKGRHYAGHKSTVSD